MINLIVKKYEKLLNEIENLSETEKEEKIFHFVTHFLRFHYKKEGVKDLVTKLGYKRVVKETPQRHLLSGELTGEILTETTFEKL